PKERRGGRPIIKRITIHSHRTQQSFCPVHAFAILRDHPQARNTVLLIYYLLTVINLKSRFKFKPFLNG
ncbi:hypothetical protein BDC45DRAFT_445984, partial [Circinella umbellata]